MGTQCHLLSIVAAATSGKIRMHVLELLHTRRYNDPLWGLIIEVRNDYYRYYLRFQRHCWVCASGTAEQ